MVPVMVVIGTKTKFYKFFLTRISMISNKRGQMKISFGMIFSIILIIIFIGVAIYGITQFLALKDSAQIGKFKDDLQGEINNIWNSGIGKQTFSGSLPGKIERVCFAKEEEGFKMNLYEDAEGFSSNDFDIDNAEVAEDADTEDDDGLCFPNEGGSISIRLEKGEGDALVQLSGLD